MDLNPICQPSPTKNIKMLIFALHSTSDDQPSDLSNEIRLKCEKGPLSDHKMKCSFLDYIQLLMIGWATRAMKVDRNVAKGPLSHQTGKCSFLGYIQLLMIGQAIQVMKVDQNVKKWNVVSVRVFCCFSLGLLLFQLGSSVHPPPQDGKIGNRVAKKFRFFRFTFNKFQPNDKSVQFFLHLLAMQLICDGQCTNGLTLHFYSL